MTNSLNPIITALVEGCNNLNVQTGLNFTPLVVTPFVDAQLFADSPNGNAINPVINQIVGFLNQVTYKSQPNIDNLAQQLGITPQQFNQNFSNPQNTTGNPSPSSNPNPNLNNDIKKTLYAPSGLNASFSYSTGLVSLSWTSNSKNNTGFKIYRSIDGINYSLIHTNGNTTTYNDSPSNVGTYYYKVTAYNEQGESNPSNIVNETISISVPTAPTNLSGTVTGLEVDLSWTGSINQTGYHVYRSTDNINFSIVNSPTGTTYNDTTPSANTYYYKISAYNAYGESLMSNTINKTTTNPIIAPVIVLDTTYASPRGYYNSTSGIEFTARIFTVPHDYVYDNYIYVYQSFDQITWSKLYTMQGYTPGGYPFGDPQYSMYVNSSTSTSHHANWYIAASLSNTPINLSNIITCSSYL